MGLVLTISIALGYFKISPIKKLQNATVLIRQGSAAVFSGKLKFTMIVLDY